MPGSPGSCTPLAFSSKNLVAQSSAPPTVTCWSQCAALPQASVAVQVTVVGPTQNNTGALFEIVIIPVQLSVAVAVPMFTTMQPVPVTVTSAGQVITGAIVSL